MTAAFWMLSQSHHNNKTTQNPKLKHKKQILYDNNLVLGTYLMNETQRGQLMLLELFC